MVERRLSVQLRQPGPIPLDVEFHCEAGTTLAIFGPSGSGKTTILRSIAGLYRPTAAKVSSGSQVWNDSASNRFVPAHQRSIGFVFQEYALFPHLTASDNVAMALTHRPSRERRERAHELLSRVRLLDKATRRPAELSGGERQRVALARALAREPAVLLLDEPFAAIDRAVRRSLREELDTIRQASSSPVILVTHDFEDAMRLASRVLLLGRGQQVAIGSIGDIVARPELAWLREAASLQATLADRPAV